jgi:AraC-like DNA-binding protein
MPHPRRPDGDPAATAAEPDQCFVPGGFVLAYVGAARRVDLEPFHQLRRAGLPTRDLDAEHMLAPCDRFLELLQQSAAASRRPDFPLLLARALGLASIGPAGLLVSAQPTLREALRVLCSHAGDGRGLRAALEERGAIAVLRVSFRGDRRQNTLAADLMLGFALRAIQSLVGAGWRPQVTRLTCEAPADEAPHRQLFGLVTFGQPFDALEFDADWLSQPLATADAGLARLAANYLGGRAVAAAPPFRDEVLDLITALLPTGACSVEAVAEQLGVDRRTVHRRLAEAGASFSELMQSVRGREAKERLAAGEPIADIARGLGFSGVSQFSRWFRKGFGAAPTRYGQPDG